MVMDCTITQEVKGLTKILSRWKIYNISLFTLFHKVMGCNIIQKVKGLTKKLYFVLLSRRNTSFYAIVTFFYMVVACITMYCQDYQQKG